MKIRFRQTGGFAGLVKSIEIDSDEISTEESEFLQSLVDQSKFFNLSGSVQHVMPDEEQYSITVETMARSRSIRTSKSAAPDDLRPLIGYLVKRAKYEKRK